MGPVQNKTVHWCLVDISYCYSLVHVHAYKNPFVRNTCHWWFGNPLHDIICAAIPYAANSVIAKIIYGIFSYDRLSLGFLYIP